MRTAARVIGWILIGAFTLHAALNVISIRQADRIADLNRRVHVPDAYDNGPLGEGVFDELASKALLAGDALSIVIGVGLVVVCRRQRQAVRPGAGRQAG